MPHTSNFLGVHWEPGQPIIYSFNASAFGYDEFSTTYRSLFETAMARWSAVADVTFQQTSDPYAAGFVIGWDRSSDGIGGTLGWTVNHDLDQDGVLETANGDRSETAIDPNDAAYFNAVAVHEVGHALGLDHVDHTPSVMTTYINGTVELTAYDIDMIQSLYGVATATTTMLTGTDDADMLVGSASSETMVGGAGHDTLSSGSGDDVLYGNMGVDCLIGSDGADTIFGGQNDGTLTGSPAALRDGWDTISGGAGDDLLYGNIGNDILVGGSGDDTIFGGQNDDSIFGGTGLDTLYGNHGADSFVYTSSYEGWDDVIGFDTAEDRIQLVGAVFIANTDFATGSTRLFLSSGTVVELVGVQLSDPASVVDYLI